jgi:hypothetical protein
MCIVVEIEGEMKVVKSKSVSERAIRMSERRGFLYSHVVRDDRQPCRASKPAMFFYLL